MRTFDTFGRKTKADELAEMEYRVLRTEKRSSGTGRRIIVGFLAAILCMGWICGCGAFAETEENGLAVAYVMVTTDTQVGFLPLPAEGEEDYSYPIRQTMEDGTEVLHVVHISSDGF